MNELPSSLLQDIRKIKQIVEEESRFKRGLFLDDVRQVKNPTLLASLLLASASFGVYRFAELEPVAVGLELLSLGVETHFSQGVPLGAPKCDIGHVSLIGGDYFYSRGISIAARIDKSQVIEGMSQAIVETMEAQTADLAGEAVQIYDFLEGKSSWLRHAALYRKACELGALLSHADLEVSEALGRFGEIIGIIQRFFEKSMAEQPAGKKVHKELDALIDEAKGSIANLPENECKTYLLCLPESLGRYA
jgi:hypothetical protein